MERRNYPRVSYLLEGTKRIFYVVERFVPKALVVHMPVADNDPEEVGVMVKKLFQYRVESQYGHLN